MCKHCFFLLLGLFYHTIEVLNNEDGEKKERKKKQILRNKAGLRGIIDYYFQRFGQGPSWLHIQKNKK